MKPSPCALISVPRWRATARRTIALWTPEQLDPLGVAELDRSLRRRLDVAEHDRQRAGVGVEAAVVAVVLGGGGRDHVDRARAQPAGCLGILYASYLSGSGVERQLDRAVPELDDLASHQDVGTFEGLAVDRRAICRAEVLDDDPTPLGSHLEVATGDLGVVEQQPVALPPDLDDVPDDEVQRRASRLTDDHRGFDHLEHVRTVASPGCRSITGVGSCGCDRSATPVARM